MRLFLATILIFFASYAYAAEVSPCDLAHGSTWKVGLHSDTPGEIHVISHCKPVEPESLSSLRAEEVAAVVGWTKKIKDLDLSRSIYRYFLIVQNDHGSALRIGLAEWKVAHAPLLATMGSEIEIPPCVAVAVRFLSPGVPRVEASYMQVSLPDAQGQWSAADIPRQMPVHVPPSSHFSREELRGQKIPARDAVSVACK